MKLLVTSDWQCSSNNLHRCELMLKHLLEVARKEKVDAVLHLGDVKDAFNPVAQQVQNFMVRATKKIRKIAPFHVLLGNHDRTAVNDESDSCMPVLRAAGALTYEKPKLVCIGGVNGTWIYMVPYFRDRKVLLEHLANIGKHVDSMDYDIRPNQGEVLLAFHAEINGCKLSTRRSTFISNSGIPSEGLWADDYALCLGGHIHYQQKCDGNIWYAGSPFQQDWGEANNPCGFLLVTLEPNHPPIVERIPSRVPGYLDPELKGFSNKAPAKSQLRVKVNCPVGSDPGVLLQTARKEAEEKYPQFHIHVVPVVDGVESLKTFDQSNAAGDEELIQRYLKQTKAKEPAAMAACILYHLRKRGLGVTGLERLRFLKATAENVLCFEKCKIQLAGSGITLVTGENRDWGESQEPRSNGSGKSSALSLPLIALFGRTPKGQSAGAWSRQSCTDPSEVRLLLLLADGRSVEVVRRRPSGLELYIARKLISSGDARETQRTIEKLLRLTWDVATNALYIGQREVGTILTGTDKERKELFSRFLGLDRFLMVQEDLRASRRSTEKAALSNAGDIDVVLGKIEQAKVEAFPNTYPLDSCERTLSRLQQTREKLNQLVTRYVSDLNGVNKTLEAASERYYKLEKMAAIADAKHQEAVRQVCKLEALSKQSVCPTCDSVLEPKQMKRLMSIAKHLANQTRTQMFKSAREASEAENTQNALRDQRAKAEKVLARERMNLENCALEEAAWQERHREALEEAARQKQQQVKLDKLKLSLKRLQDYQGQLSDHMHFLTRCLIVVGREGLPAYLCGSICPALNASALKFSELFTSGALGVQFTFSEGELDIQVENHQGGSGINDQSQGEMRMIGLIAAFALRDVLVPYNLLILDEPGEGLDAVNAKAFADGLSEVTERFGSLFVVTHNTHILSALEPTRRLHVIKENQVSQLEELL